MARVVMERVAGGSLYPDPDLWSGSPEEVADAWEQHAVAEDAAHRMLGMKTDRAVAAADAALAKAAAAMSASGVGPGSVPDASVAAALLDASSQARKALDTWHKSADRVGLRAEDFGVKADGVTDDTDAIKAGLAASAQWQMPLHLPLDGIIRLTGTRSIPDGASNAGHGSTLTWPQSTGIGSWLILATGTTGVSLADLTLRTTTAEIANQRGLAAVGAHRLKLDNVRVESATAGAGSASNNALGFLLQECDGMELSRLSVEGFDNAFRLNRCNDLSLNGFNVHLYRLGLWISDCKRLHATDARIWGRTPNQTQDSGNNGVLIDADTAQGASHITLEDFLVEDSGETGYRIGGQVPIWHVSFVRCKTLRAGSNGFKTLGGTVESGSRHRYIRYIDCFVEDCGLGGGTNCAGVAVHLSDDVTISNLVVQASGASGFSCREGVYVSGASRVSIVNPSVTRPSYAAISCRGVLGDVGDVTVDGGRFAVQNGANVFDFQWEGRTFRRIGVTGHPTVELYGDGYVVHARKDDASSAVGGIGVSWTAGNNTVIKNICTGTGRADVRADIVGPVPADLTTADFKPGSRWAGPTSETALGIKRTTGWTWL